MDGLTIYDISIGVYKNGLTVLLGILDKAAQHPKAATLASASLIDDMKPLTFQVQSVSNTVTKSLRKLLDDDPEIKDWEDNETTLEQAIERARKTLDLVESIDPERLKGRDVSMVKIKSGDITGRKWILGFTMPNFFFHLQTAYAILRAAGVDLGKDDYAAPWRNI